MGTDKTPWWAIRYEAVAALHPAFAGEIDLHCEAQIDLLEQLLELRPGTRIVDIGCGGGRHSVVLQERGHKVTGVDLSPRILQLARRAWTERGAEGPAPTFMPGDMRWLPTPGPFDLGIFMDMALGVFDEDEDHVASLRSLSERLVEGGQVFIELFNPYYWAHHAHTVHFPPGRLVAEADVVRKYRFDAVAGRLLDEIILFRGGKRHPLPTQSLRAWTPPEITRLLHRAGFEDVRVFGSEGWEVPDTPVPLHPEQSVWMWIAARKAGAGSGASLASG